MCPTPMTLPTPAAILEVPHTAGFRETHDVAARPPHTVTFDCWGTLLVQDIGAGARAARIDAVVEVANGAGAGIDADAGAAALDLAWQRHHALWEQGVVTGAAEMAAWALASVGVRVPAPAARLAARWGDLSLDIGVRALDGAAASVAALSAAGVRLALVCDTGFSSGTVVRRLLGSVGLLDPLEVTTFSDEIGVPKPHPRMFTSTLDALGVDAAGAVHVGDLRRTDVAGARGVGMDTVRITWANDDTAALPDADVVADSHAHLAVLLGVA